MICKSKSILIVLAALIGLAGFAWPASGQTLASSRNMPVEIRLPQADLIRGPQTGPVTLSLPDLNVMPTQTFTATLQLNLDTQQVYSADLVLRYDPAVVSIGQVLPGGLASSWYMAINTATAGVIRVAMAGATPITASGELLRLVFTAANSPGSSSDLTFERCQLDEGSVTSQTQDGQVYIARPVLAAFSASPLTGPAALPVTFHNTSSGDYASVAWNFGDLATSTAISPTHTYAQPGTYSVSLTVSGIGGVDVLTRTNYITTYSLTVSGRVQYWKNGESVSGVGMELSGAQTYTATTDATGVYTISGVLAGDYTLTPGKSDGVKGISAYDASLALQHVATNITLTGYSAVAADVNKNSSIGTLDATYMLQKAVGSITLPFEGATQIWEFDQPSRTYLGLSANQTAQDFTAILLGDPSGNWAASSWLLRPKPAAPQAPAILSILGGKPDANGIVTATVQLDPSGASIYSAELNLLYDPAKAQFLGYAAAPMTHNWLSASNASRPGELRLALAGSQPTSQKGALAYLRFQLTSPSAIVRLQPASGSLNEGNTPVTLLEGPLVEWLYLYLPSVRK